MRNCCHTLFNNGVPPVVPPTNIYRGNSSCLKCPEDRVKIIKFDNMSVDETILIADVVLKIGNLIASENINSNRFHTRVIPQGDHTYNVEIMPSFPCRFGQKGLPKRANGLAQKGRPIPDIIHIHKQYNYDQAEACTHASNKAKGKIYASVFDRIRRIFKGIRLHKT